MRAIITILIAIMLFGCSYEQQRSETILAEQKIGALLWVQNSSEYIALTIQAFNMARYSFENAKKIPGKRNAVIMDIDETILNSTPFNAQQVKYNNLNYKVNWHEWVSREKAVALSGAVSFANFVVEQGGAVFYVSNRNETDYYHTLNNLSTNGFPNLSRETILLRDKSSNKQARFDKINNAGYNIVVFLGDNLDDFGDIFFHKKSNKRKLTVLENAKDFGRHFILVPNPIYGSWENVLNDKYPGFDVNERVVVHKELIMRNSFK